MRELRRLSKRGDIPIQMSEPLMQMRITGTDVSYVCLEMLNIYGIEPHDCRIQSHICFRNVLAKIIRPFSSRKMFLNTVQGSEELSYGFAIRFLGGGEARAVDPVVDIRVDP